MSVFHHYSFAADAEDASTIAEDVWLFCLAAVGGTGVDHRPRK